MEVALRAVLGLLAALAASSASAQTCEQFTSENRPQGEVVAFFHDGERTLEIVDEYTGSKIYDLVSAGTGLPYEVGIPKGEKPDSPNAITVREHKGDLLIDMIAYERFCLE